MSGHNNTHHTASANKQHGALRFDRKVADNGFDVVHLVIHVLRRDLIVLVLFGLVGDEEAAVGAK
jgi:hypothetical protein